MTINCPFRAVAQSVVGPHADKIPPALCRLRQCRPVTVEDCKRCQSDAPPRRPPGWLVHRQRTCSMCELDCAAKRRLSKTFNCWLRQPAACCPADPPKWKPEA